jgi:hypothetical protein
MSGMDFAAVGANLGRALMGGGDAFESGRTKMAQLLADANYKQAHADYLTNKAAVEKQRAVYQTPEYATKFAGALAGLGDDQAAQMEEFRKTGSWGMNPAMPDEAKQMTIAPAPKAAPSFYTPELTAKYDAARAAGMLNLAATGDAKPDDVAKAFAELLGQNRIDSAIADPSKAPAFGKAMAASKGQALFNQGSNGVMDNFTGVERINDVGRSVIGENNAQASNAYASAGAHNASRQKTMAEIPEIQSKIDLNRSKIGQTNTVTMPDGTEITTGPVMPKLTEIQAKSQLFGSRAAEADRIMRELDGKYSPLAINTKLGAEGVFGIGGMLGAIGNKALPPEAQQAEQAQRDFINAVLRQESGAAIAPSEFDNARKQYFPQPGDSEEVLNQKKENRKTAIEGLKVMAGPASGMVNYGGRKQPGQAPAIDKTQALSEAKAAIARGAPRAAVIQRLKEMGINEGAI